MVRCDKRGVRMEHLKWLVEHFCKEYQAIRKAPVAFGVALLILFGSAYGLINWYYAGVVQDQKAHIALLAEQIKNLPKPSPTLPALTPSPAEITSLRLLSDKDFAQAVFRLTEDLRSVDLAYTKEEQRLTFMRGSNSGSDEEKQRRWQELMRMNLDLSSRRDSEWQLKYRPKARAYYEELCRRLAIVPDPSRQVATLTPSYLGQEVITYGALVGPNPLSALADFLDSLAHQLD